MPVCPPAKVRETEAFTVLLQHSTLILSWSVAVPARVVGLVSMNCRAISNTTLSETRPSTSSDPLARKNAVTATGLPDGEGEDETCLHRDGAGRDAEVDADPAGHQEADLEVVDLAAEHPQRDVPAAAERPVGQHERVGVGREVEVDREPWVEEPDLDPQAEAEAAEGEDADAHVRQGE